MPTRDGLLIVDKPSGWTSHDVVARCRRLAGTRKVGHAGTLDPMATGVLVVGIGRATRLLGHLALTTKEYDATIRLGRTTVTDDAEGDVLESHDASSVTDAAVAAAMCTLTGAVSQVPSSVSAVKVEGRRSYHRVRSGDEVALAARPVTVSSFALLHVTRSATTVDLTVHVACSTGTYVRALARDLGAALGVGGHLTALRRTRVGTFDLSAAHTLDSLADHLDVMSLERAAAASFATFTVSGADVVAVRNGRALETQLMAPSPVAMVTGSGEFLALYEQRGLVAKAVAVFAPAVGQAG